MQRGADARPTAGARRRRLGPGGSARLRRTARSGGVTDSQLPRYEIFIVERPGRPPTYAGCVHASDDELALLNARDVFAPRPDCHGLWAFRAETISSRTDGE